MAHSFVLFILVDRLLPQPPLYFHLGTSAFCLYFHQLNDSAHSPTYFVTVITLFGKSLAPLAP